MVRHAEYLRGRGLVVGLAISVRTTVARAVAHTTAWTSKRMVLMMGEEEAHWVTGHAWEQAEAEGRGKRQQGNIVVGSSSSRCFSALRKLLNTQVSADTTKLCI